MYLLFGIMIGALYGRNARAVNQKTCEDIKKVWDAFAATRLAFNLYVVADALYELIANLHKREVVYLHDLLCECNKCKPVSINTYVRRLKAIN